MICAEALSHTQLVVCTSPQFGIQNKSLQEEWGMDDGGMFKWEGVARCGLIRKAIMQHVCLVIVIDDTIGMTSVDAKG